MMIATELRGCLDADDETALWRKLVTTLGRAGLPAIVDTAEGERHGPSDSERVCALHDQLASHARRAFRERRTIYASRDDAPGVESVGLGWVVSACVGAPPLAVLTLYGFALRARPPVAVVELIADLAAQAVMRQRERKLLLAEMRHHKDAVHRVEPCDPAALVAQAIAYVDPVARATKVRARIAVEPQLPRVVLDPTHIERMLAAVLGHAVRFSPEGGVIEVGCRTHDHGIEFFVHHQGPPVPLPDYFEERIHLTNDAGWSATFTFTVPALQPS